MPRAGGHPVYDYTTPLVPILAASYVREILPPIFGSSAFITTKPLLMGLIGSASRM